MTKVIKYAKLHISPKLFLVKSKYTKFILKRRESMKRKLVKVLMKTVLTMVLIVSVTTLDINFTVDSNSVVPETDLPFEY